MIKLTSNLPEFTAKLRVAAQLVKSRRQSIHKAFGIYLLSRAKRDFETMSRGGTSSFGEKWAPIKDETVKARITKLGAYKDKSAAVKKARTSIQNHRAIFGESLKAMRNSARGSDAYKAAATKARKARNAIAKQKRIVKRVKGAETESELKRAARQQKGVTKRIARAQKQLDVAKARRSTIRGSVTAPKEHARTIAKLEKKVAKAKQTRAKYLAKMTSSHQIGVDTGRLRNSSQPGYKGDDGKGGNVFETTEAGVKVGYDRTYAGHFDAKRKLLPAEGEMPEDWRRGLEAIAKRQTLAAMGDAFKGEQGTVIPVDPGE